MKKARSVWLIALLVSGMLMACYAQAEEKPQYGGILKIHRNVPPADPIGHIPEMGPSGYNIVNDVVLEALYSVKGAGEYVPMLATSWKIAADLSYVDFTLRKGVKFHDGTDFNAQACKWNLDRWIAARGGKKPMWKSVEVLDDYKVRVNLNYFRNTSIGGLSDQGMFMVSPTAYEKNGEEWARWNPVGTGPFKFVKYERDVKMTFTKFEDYWQKGKPYVDGIEAVILNDLMTTQLAFQGNKLHYVELPGKQAADLKAAGFQYSVLNPATRPVHALVPSSANPGSPLSNLKVRQAISYAINRKVLCDALGYGWKDPIHQIAPSGAIAHIPELEKMAGYDPEKAKKLLTEAGFPNGFKTKLIVAPRWVDRDMQVAIQAELAKVGIKIELEYPEEGKYSEYRWREAGWKEGLLFQEFANWPSYTEHLSFYWNHMPAQFFDMEWPEGLHNAVSAAMQTPQIQKDMVQKVVRMIFDHMTVIPLYEFKRVAFFRDGVHDTGILTFGFFADWTPADAWLEKKAWIKE